MGAAGAAASQTCDASAYALTIQSLTGPGGADLAVHIQTNSADCALPDTLAVQARILPFRNHRSRVVDFPSVAASAGSASVHLGRVARHQGVAATVVFDPQITLSAQTRTLLRPDLVLRRLQAPRVTLTGRAFNVHVIVGEPKPDVGASAIVTVSALGAVVASAPVTIAPRERAVLNLPVTLPKAGAARIDVAIVGANPAETTTANNARSTTVEAADFQVVPGNVIVPDLAGYGGQFNHHVYAAISRAVGVSDDNLPILEQEIRALHPQFSRIFFHPSSFTDPDAMESFYRTVLLAQSTGTTFNVTWQGGRLDLASGTVQKFAKVLIDLVKNYGVTRLRWLTLQNEPNSTKMTPAQYELQYRQLDPYIQSIRGQVQYMGGDLVRENQKVWFDYMATHMSDILSAYSIHVFWDYWDTEKLQARLTEVRTLVDALPTSEQKPLYVAEYGVRGQRTFHGAPQVDPGVWNDGTPIAQTNVSAFQHAWFDIMSARLGYYGTSKWDSYFGKYDAGTQAYYMIGNAQSGWPLFPLYNFIHLLTTTVRPTWKIVELDEVPGTRLAAGYVSPKGEETIIGLDTAGAQLNTVSDTEIQYVIGGLPPARNARLAIWNSGGDGLVGRATTVTTDAVGVATITVPQNAVFALTTLRLY